MSGKRNKQQRAKQQKEERRRKNNRLSKLLPKLTIASLVKKITKMGWQIVVGLGVVVGLVAFFYPRISVAPSSTPDLQNALKSPFVIKNDSYIPLVDVKVETGIDTIIFRSKKTGYSITVNGAPKFTTKFADNMTFPVLETGESMTFVPPNELSLPLTMEKFKISELFLESAKISIAVSYEPKYVPWRMTLSRRFNTTINSDGKVIWNPVPMEDPHPN